MCCVFYWYGSSHLHFSLQLLLARGALSSLFSLCYSVLCCVCAAVAHGWPLSMCSTRCCVAYALLCVCAPVVILSIRAHEFYPRRAPTHPPYPAFLFSPLFFCRPCKTAVMKVASGDSMGAIAGWQCTWTTKASPARPNQTRNNSTRAHDSH